MRPARTAARLTVAAALALGLTACTVAVDGGDARRRPPPEETTTEESAPAEDAEETDDAAAETGSDGELPDWANPVATPGEQISTFNVGNVRVDPYQVGVTPASKDGLFVDPDTNQPLIAAGDDIVFINYVITNEGDPIDLGFSLVSIDERYDDWPYMQGMDTIVDDALYEAQGVHDDAMHNQAYREPSVYPFATGQSYSYATNFRYQPGSPITFDAVMVPPPWTRRASSCTTSASRARAPARSPDAARACRESPGPEDRALVRSAPGQVLVLRVPLDVRADEGAQRDDALTRLPHAVERAGGERGPDAAPLERGVDLGVREDHRARLPHVGGEAGDDAVVGAGLEAVALVGDGDGGRAGCGAVGHAAIVVGPAPPDNHGATPETAVTSGVATRIRYRPDGFRVRHWDGGPGFPVAR